MQYARRVNIGFIRCQQQPHFQRVVDVISASGRSDETRIQHDLQTGIGSECG